MMMMTTMVMNKRKCIYIHLGFFKIVTKIIHSSVPHHRSLLDIVNSNISMW